METPVRRASFVLHDHRVPRPHFDLRLEQDGVLKSWAVPRGLPDSPTRNRLAVQVPDHDLDHLTYTDENKFIADIGWWEEEDRTDRRFVFVLHGRESSLRYALIRTDTDWLLHRTKEQPRVAGAPGPGQAAQMPQLKVGDKVSWNTPQGTTHGVVKEIRKKDFQLAGQKFTASPDEPTYVVESEKSGHRAAHQEQALTRHS
ncbi:HVA1 family protein [Kineosporia babensis]|uniref:HVA1 family protein n=2 Tax=Kineosporia babensis TaxID=499548 RepID=A0A9X1STF2_9ACTN|nr:HVA1 family protein [Kineosporia babensis]